MAIGNAHKTINYKDNLDLAKIISGDVNSESPLGAVESNQSTQVVQKQGDSGY